MAMVDDLAANVETAERLVRKAAADGARIVLVPELFEGRTSARTSCPQHFDRARPVDGHPTVAHFRAVAAELDVVLPVSFYERADRRRSTRVAIVDADGAVLGIYRKSHIPDGPGYTEKYYFNPGDTGFRVWPTRHATIGVAICWDQWFPESARAMALLGAEAAALPHGYRVRAARPDVGFVRALAAGDAGPRRREPHAAGRREPQSVTEQRRNHARSPSTGPRSSPTPTGAKIVTRAGRDDEAVLTASFDSSCPATPAERLGSVP